VPTRSRIHFPSLVGIDKNQNLLLLRSISSRHVVVAGGDDPGRPRRGQLQYKLLQFGTTAPA